MESRWGESSRGSSYGESRSYSYSEPRRVSTGESRRSVSGESRGKSLESSSEPRQRSGRIAELKEELAALKREIIQEKKLKEKERQEEEALLIEIAEARQELDTLRNGSKKRR